MTDSIFTNAGEPFSDWDETRIQAHLDHHPSTPGCVHCAYELGFDDSTKLYANRKQIGEWWEHKAIYSKGEGIFIGVFWFLAGLAASGAVVFAIDVWQNNVR